MDSLTQEEERNKKYVTAHQSQEACQIDFFGFLWG
jgi:hypothetical protein